MLYPPPDALMALMLPPSNLTATSAIVRPILQGISIAHNSLSKYCDNYGSSALVSSKDFLSYYLRYTHRRIGEIFNIINDNH